MRIAVNIGPTGDWSAMLAAAKEADALGFDSVGFLDHYHSDEPEWQAYICGWSAYGALAMATSRIHLTPMVIDRLNCLSARQTIAAASRPVALSVFVWDWLDDIEERLLAWEKLGVARTFVTCWHPFDKLPPLAKLL